MKRAIILSIFCLWPFAARADGIESVYSKFDLDHCRLIDKGDEFVYAGTWSCKGFKGIDIIQAVADDRSFVAFGKDGARHCAFHKTFFGFNTALSPVEWRLHGGKPVAAIERWRVVVDEGGTTVTWLVVNALRPNETCHAHYVAGSYPDANGAARRAADERAAGFDCENGVPTVDSTVGDPPINLVACSEVARGD